MLNEFLSKTSHINLPLKDLVEEVMPLRDVGLSMRNMVERRFDNRDHFGAPWDIFVLDEIAEYFGLKIEELRLLMSIIIQPIFEIVSLESILDKSIYNKLIEQEIVDNLIDLPNEKVSYIFDIGQKLLKSKENFILNDLMNGEAVGSNYFSLLDGIIKRIPSLLPQFIESKLNLLHESIFGFISVIEDIMEAKINLTGLLTTLPKMAVTEHQILKIFKALDMNEGELGNKLAVFKKKDYFNHVKESKSVLLSRLSPNVKPLTSDIVLNFIDLLVANSIQVPITLVELVQELSIDVTTSFLIMLNLLDEGYFEITDIFYNMARVFPDKLAAIIKNKEKFFDEDLMKFTSFENSVLLGVIFTNLEKLSAIHAEYTDLMGLPFLSLSEFITMASPKVTSIINQKKQSLLSLSRMPLLQEENYVDF